MLVLYNTCSIRDKVDCPIFCGGDGFENFEAGGELSDRATSEELRKYLEGLNDDDLGKYKM